jgi:hypothetical protein
VTAPQRHWYWLNVKRFIASLRSLNALISTGSIASRCWVIPNTLSRCTVVSNLVGVERGPRRHAQQRI